MTSGVLERPAPVTDPAGPERPERGAKPAAKHASAATARATAFVAARRSAARALGVELAEHVGDPEGFVAALRRGLATLADPVYIEGQRFVAPGIGPTLGIRTPLLAAVGSGLKSATRGDRPAPLLAIADRSLREEYREAHWLAFGLFERLVLRDPERTWQLMRRAARAADEWVTVDTLARPYARGVLDARFRWAELEQLVYSPSRWERRLVGSTIATIPHTDRARGRTPEMATQGLTLIARLIGDAEPDVQKALSWAYRTVAEVHPEATLRALELETETAARHGDGHRAWVIRDALSKLPASDARRLRARLGGLRRSSSEPSTSEAAAIGARFGDLPDPRNHPEPPLG